MATCTVTLTTAVYRLCYLGCGELAPPSGGGGWTATILYNLSSSGYNPNASVVEFGNGLLYGTT